MKNPFKRPMEVSEFRVADYLDSEEAIAEFLTAALEENDPEFFQKALGEVAKARGMAQVAERAGVGRESLYKSLSAEGNPRFSTIVDVLDALGFKLVVTPGS
ncbi:putative addiction module antidote protein [Eggerthella guodeyinii]|uniref:Putative addiction module antidote protein n=1 Tax=Eggerthella guodeyinii TaxID=2690837 RepID=A0A6L7IWR6_9ACTN|nr:addiction module antidote protein [Eggerthella guodeyinii]QOS67141.1 putative addiction module antidote protein [Eggerthella guodeyinii]